VHLTLGQVLYEPGGTMTHAYFPTTSVGITRSNSSLDDRLLPETGKERLGSAFEEAPSLS
jgi:hypothetical protein